MLSGRNVPEPVVLHTPVVDAPEMLPFSGTERLSEQMVMVPPAFAAESGAMVYVTVSSPGRHDP